MVVAIYSKAISVEFLSYFKRLMSCLKQERIDVFCEEGFARFLEEQLDYRPDFIGTFNEKSGLPVEVEILLSIGGDGTFLDSVVYVKDNGVPVLGINSGHLGFLANVPEYNIEEAVSSISLGEYHIESREMLHLSVGEETIPGFDYALNEVGVLKSVDSTLLRIYAHVGDNFLTTYWADGLIVATPTGSTAYSMSGGGPILTPDCQNIILTPVCAHNLNVRPLVVPNYEEIVLKVESRTKNFMLTMDSRMRQMTDTYALTIRTRVKKLNILKLPRNNFYDTLRGKLMWGEDRRNEEFEKVFRRVGH